MSYAPIRSQELFSASVPLCFCASLLPQLCGLNVLSDDPRFTNVASGVEEVGGAEGALALGALVAPPAVAAALGVDAGERAAQERRREALDDLGLREVSERRLETEPATEGPREDIAHPAEKICAGVGKGVGREGAMRDAVNPMSGAPQAGGGEEPEIAARQRHRLIWCARSWHPAVPEGPVLPHERCDRCLQHDERGDLSPRPVPQQPPKPPPLNAFPAVALGHVEGLHANTTRHYVLEEVGALDAPANQCSDASFLHHKGDSCAAIVERPTSRGSEGVYRPTSDVRRNAYRCR